MSLVWQDVAVKVFSKQEYSDDIILSFRQEVGFLAISLKMHLLKVVFVVFSLFFSHFLFGVLSVCQILI